MVAFSAPCQIPILGYTGSFNSIRRCEEQDSVLAQQIGGHDRAWRADDQSLTFNAPTGFTNHSTTLLAQRQEKLGVSDLYSLPTLPHVFAYSPPTPLLYLMP